MKTQFIGIAAVGLLLVGGYGSPTQAETGSQQEPGSETKANRARIANDPNRRLEQFEVEAKDLSHAAQALATFGLNVGLVLDRDNPPITLRLKNVKVSDVLDALVAQTPGYRWSIAHGVFHISPKSIPAGSGLSPLYEKTPPFSSSGHGIMVTIMRLMNHGASAGLKIASVNLSTAVIANSLDNVREDARISVSFTEPVAVADILDAIVAYDPPAFWSAYTSSKGQLVLTGTHTHKHTKPSKAHRRLGIIGKDSK